MKVIVAENYFYYNNLLNIIQLLVVRYSGPAKHSTWQEYISAPILRGLTTKEETPGWGTNMLLRGHRGTLLDLQLTAHS